MKSVETLKQRLERLLDQRQNNLPGGITKKDVNLLWSNPRTGSVIVEVKNTGTQYFLTKSHNLRLI